MLVGILSTSLALVACGGSATSTASVGTARAGTTAASSAQASATGQTTAPQPGSFTAFCPAIRVRFLAPPRVMNDPNACQRDNLFLSTNITYAAGVEYLTIFRYTGDARGATADGWQQIEDAIHATDTASGDTAWSATAPPMPRTAQGSPGFIGQFLRTDKGSTRYTGTLWAGAVGGDTIVVLGQASADQQATLDGDIAQVLQTIDMNAQ